MMDAEAIAKGLTPAQARWLMLARVPEGAGKWPVRNSLIDKGLAKDYPWSVTTLGLAVREILLSERKHT